jgi:hypothetical protein
LQTLKLGGMPTEECEVDGRLRALLDETQDFIDCPDFRLVLSSAMARIVDLSISNIARNASLDRSDISPPREISALARFHQIDSDDPSLSQEPAHTTARIVDILPVISKESLSILNVIPNEYIEVSFCHFFHILLAGLTLQSDMTFFSSFCRLSVRLPS